MQDVMIDLETLDTRASAVILSIGAVRFDMEASEAPMTSFHVAIDIDSNLSLGRTVSGSTILWWLDQSDDARSRLIEANRIPLRDALLKLSSFLTDKDRVWGNGAAFDNGILADAYRACGLSQPWRFWNDLCYRTLKVLHSDVAKPTHNGVLHDALDDARLQARHLQLIYKHAGQPKAASRAS